MKRRYVPDRYAILYDGVLTIYAKAAEREIGQAEQLAMIIAKEIDRLGDFNFRHLTWEYEQKYHCELGTAEALIECKLLDYFWKGYWQGAYREVDKLKDIVIRIKIDALECGSKYHEVGA